MSIRIHELAKRYNMEGKEMLALLRERGYVSPDTRSVSSTVSKIYEEEVHKEFAAKAVAAAPVVSAPVAPAPVDAAHEPPAVKIPTGVFVKSKDDVVREREEAKAAAVAAARPPAPPAVVAAPVIPAPAPVSSPPPVVPVARPMMSAPPALPVRPPTVPPVARPAPITTSPVMTRPASAPSSFSPPPVLPAKVAPVSAPSAPAPVAPPVVVRPPLAAPAPVAPPSSFSPPPVPVRPSAPPPLPSTGPKPPPAFIAGNPVAPAVTPAIPVATFSQQGDVKIIHMKPPVIVRDFATALAVKPFKLISELMEMGIFASMTQSLDEAVAIKVAEKHGFLLEIKHRGDVASQQAAKEKEKAKQLKPTVDDSANLSPRPPVVCILGHVDHGKTSLLDAIRKANVAAGEAGGITQHIGAYQIEHNGKKITFLDTPGHAAFSKMRARGANVTDIAVLVVAADDGFMLQTDEALKHAQNAKVALMVAVNKMDVKGANLDRVKSQMQERGIAPEDWGGETITVPVSAIKGTGITELLDYVLLQSDVLELRANPKGEVSGVIIESQIDVGRGPLATVIVQRGTLKVGDALVCGSHWAKVRAMFDDQGNTLKEAPPSTPVRIIGWSGAPDSGHQFRSVKNPREAEKLAEEIQHEARKEASTLAAVPKNVSVEQLFADIAATQAKTLKVIIKTDVFGSSEAVRNVLENIKSNKVSLEIVSTDVGLVTKNDVLMAGAAGAVVIGFNTKLENGVTAVAKHHKVRVETYGIIYELGDKVREMMADLLDPDLKEVRTGAAEVRATFPLAKGFVAGCLVTEGKIVRNSRARLRRKKDTVHEGRVDTLKRFKDDANEVRAGLECGIKLDDFNGYEIGDVIEVFEVQKVRASL
ncbi:MAG TPA: translation initiation factor IF-2 [Opitutaceae bacterium]|nr:translation initiation factor IF-2 [Opitutaceae bacterium]HRE05150.1 translation initiation factor IF-2 [Opitutaceae bacterium]